MVAGRFASTRIVFDWLLRALAVIVLGLMFARAVLCLSQSYDVWYYHMQFATRLARIVTPDVFIFYPEDAERFKGFPLLGEAIQGMLWRITGRAESANLLAFSSIPVLAWFLQRRFAVPWHISVLALLAIPIAHVHSVNSHVDLPGSAATAALVLIALQAFASVEPLSIGMLALAALAGAFAVNTKAVVEPVVLVSLVLIGLRILLLSRHLPEPLKRRYHRALVVLALLLPIIFATPLRNTILYRNPVYPFRTLLLGHQLPGPEADYVSSPVWLEHASRPTRFLLSLLEIRVPSFTDPERWNVGQWTPMTHPGYRMGGFFNVYVVLNLGLLGLRLFRERSREARAAAAGFGLVTLITSVMPQSHELRYYMYWMLVLVGINLWLACRPGAILIGSLGFGGVAAVTLGIVVLVTRGVYQTPTRFSFADMLQAHVDEKAIARIHDGETICATHDPYNLLWAAPFHPPRKYAVQSAQVATECRGYRRIEPARHRRRTH
jgi:hypothetical protein